MSKKPLFITATGTGIGKTATTTALCWQLRQKGKAVTALKPVISGYTTEDETSDTALILKACGISPTPEAIAAISPWRFKAPLAPNMAGALEGREIDFHALVEFCRDQQALAAGQTIVEGVGGVHVPLNSTHTTADWMQALNWPTLLVTGSYLGAISHTLSALEVLQHRNIPVRAIIISESENSTVSPHETMATLELFVRGAAPVIMIPHMGDSARPNMGDSARPNMGDSARPHMGDSARLWTRWPPLSWICDE